MSLQKAFSGFLSTLILVADLPENPDSAPTPDEDVSESVHELLSRNNMELITTHNMSPDHLSLLKSCPYTAEYSRVIIDKDVVSATTSSTDLGSFIENKDSYVVGKLSLEETPQTPASMCTLSIRTMLGDTIKARFRADESLSDVKRWLHKENNISFKPEEDEVVSRYTSIGHFKPSRYAFFSPATRTTFTESQELLRLKDLGLCPRSALLLRPDFDESAMNAARAAESQSSLKSFWTKSKVVLQAIYQFFDYGVDEAHHDFQDMVEEIENEETFSNSIFGAFAAPVPAGKSLAPTTSIIEPEADPSQEASVQEKSQVYGEEVNCNI